MKDFSFNTLSLRLRQKKFSIFQQKNILYCYKGLIGKITPLVVHFSMILVLFGTVIGSLFGLKSQELISKTEVFHIQNILNASNISVLPHLSNRINDFWINYTEKETISQFYSDLSILDENGHEIVQKTIFVNSPLIYKGIYYYQTDWELTGVRFKNDKGTVFEYPLVSLMVNKKKVWLTWISNKILFRDKLILIFDNLEGYGSIYDKNGIFIGNIELNEYYENIQMLDILPLTGLQIKTDPGIPFIYFGFFYLIISIFLSYKTYSQLWILQRNKRLFVGGEKISSTSIIDDHSFVLLLKRYQRQFSVAP